ncbi:single-stranded DNA-binding protein [Candidatus Gracilibacteria bacterium]|nr:single-stranded DNA-binding protein [Candidatus Gracilibacteria bacterium]
MRSINKVILIGNLTRDPEMRQTPSGQNVTTYGLATNRDWTTKTGEKKSSAEFHECVAWAKLAEICQNHLKKGMLVYVEGYLKTRSWESQEGIKKFKTEIVVQDMIMLEKKSDKESGTYMEESSTDEDHGFFGSDDSKGDDSKGDDSKGDDDSDDDDTTTTETPAETPETTPEAAPTEIPTETPVETPVETPAETPEEDNPIDRDLGL